MQFNLSIDLPGGRFFHWVGVLSGINHLEMLRCLTVHMNQFDRKGALRQQSTECGAYGPVTRAATPPVFSSSLNRFRLVLTDLHILELPWSGLAVVWLKRRGKVDSHRAGKCPFTYQGIIQA